MPINSNLLKNISEISKDLGIVQSAVFLSALGILFSRYTGRNDLLIGLLLNGRPAEIPEAEYMVGMFMNTLPYRCNLSNVDTVEQLLLKAHEDQLRITHHQHVSLKQISTICECTNEYQLIQVILDNKIGLSRDPSTSKSVNKITSNSYSQKDEATSMARQSVPFHCNLEFSNEGIIFTVTCDPSKYNSKTLPGFCDRFISILGQLCSNPKQKIDSVSIFLGDEEHLIDSYQSGSFLAIAPKDNVVSLFLDQCKKRPHHDAIIYNSVSISYDELHKKAVLVATHLANLDIFAGDVVALKLDRSEKVPIVILAIFYLGAIYVPIDSTVPVSRVLDILNDCKPKLLISESNEMLLGKLKYCNVNSLLEATDVPLKSDLPTNLSSEDIAYILFTSGSTGKPKGIKIPHRVLISRIRVDPIPYLENEVIASKTSFAFVDFLWELFLPLSNGGTCKIIPSQSCKDPALLCSNLQSDNIHRIVLVPSLLSVILELPRATLQKLSNLKFWFSTGEPLFSDTAKRFYECFPDSRLFNLYGASEVWDISIGEVPSDISILSNITSGKPLGNTSVYILDDNKQKLPPGFVGSIYVAGEHVASGYLDVIHTPISSFSKLNISGQYQPCWKTGDLGFWNNNGDLVVLGRLDNQVKIRGYRIDLQDIESVAKTSPLVHDCAVTLTNSEQIGISVIFNNDEDNSSVLREFLGSHLPQYMIPSVYHILDSFPQLSSGKINRKKLSEELSLFADNILPENKDISLTKTEKLVATIASSLFKQENISVDTNFFEAGGHSLMAVRLLSKVSKQLSKQIPLEALFSNPVLRDLAEFIDSYTKSSTLPVAQVDYESLSPLSLAQRRLWIVDALADKKDTYILSTTVSLDFIVDIDVLRTTVSHLIDRHSSLRTLFVTVDSEPYQKVSDELSPPVLVIERDNSSYELDNCSLHQLFEAFPLTWSLVDGPLFYVLVLNDPHGKAFVCLKFHHIISDGVSVKIFTDEMLLVYNNLLHSRRWDIGLSALNLQYRDYAIWQYDWNRSEEFSKDLEFWSSLLSGRLSKIDFVRTHGSSVSLTQAHSFNSRIGPSILKRIRILAKRCKTSTFNVFLTLFGLYISRLCGETCVNVGTPVTGRTVDDLQNVIGFFVNLLVYPLTIDERHSLYEQVLSVSSLGKEIFSHQNIQFEQLVSKISPDRDESGQPLFQVMLVHEIVSNNVLPNSVAQRFASSNEHANYDYVLLIREHIDHLELTHQVRANIFSRPALRAMAMRFNCLLSRCTNKPDVTLSSISMLTPLDRRKIFDRWNNTSIPNPYLDHNIASLYFQLAKKSPSSVSVVEQSVSWTRHQVVLLASHYQSVIRSLNPAKGQFICLLLDKGAHQVALVLAINGLGHAFVPLDPSAPLERTKLIIDSCCPSILFSDREIDSALCAKNTIVYQIDPRSITINSPDTSIDSFLTTASSSDCSYVCFTSGSTGIPKGVVVSNLNIISLFHAHSQYFRLSPESRVLSTLGFYFDAGIGEQIRALLSGATLCFTGLDLLRNPSELVNSLENLTITHVGIPPSVLQALCSCPLPSLKSLKVLVTAGESLSANTAKFWGAKRTIITGHGATETTVGDTILSNWNLDKPPSLGRPLPNMKAYVLNNYLQINPPYVIGQLVITGPQVSSGYLGDPLKTSAVFLNELPGIESPYRFYLTGDLVYYDNHGILHFSGRNDSQVKIRGHRIEMPDIEAVALSSPGVSQATCTCIEEASSKYLVLYFSSLGIDASTLNEYLTNRLPSYMIPSEIIEVPSIPVTQNGKINYSALPSPSLGQDVSEIVPPGSDTERLLFNIWSEVLSVKNLSVTSNFFSVGGDSIRAVQMLAKCSQSGLRITPLDLFKYQSIRALAIHLDSLSSLPT